MHKFLICGVFSCLGLLLSGQEISGFRTEENEKFIRVVDPFEFKTLIESGKGIVLDVRTPEEVAQGTIANASVLNFYDQDFAEKLRLMDKSAEIYVYCRAGGRSAKAARILQENGFNRVYDLRNGITAWIEAGYEKDKSAAYTTEDHGQHMSLADFLSELQSDLPVLVDFHTRWCAPCRKMAPVIDKIETEFSGRVKILRVDVDKCKDIGKAYEVQGVPVFRVFKNGQTTWSHTGIIPEFELKNRLEKLL
jgi:thioredoxin